MGPEALRASPGRYPALARCHAFATRLLGAARAALAAEAADLGAVVTVAACGSLGRLEAYRHSDLDLVVVIRGDVGEGAIEKQMHRIRRALDTLALKPAKPWGIYRQPVTLEALVDDAGLGSLSEPPDLFGKRLQLLLDARALHAEAAFAEVRGRVLAWYARAFIEHAPRRGWTYLINDLARYLHAYAAWQQFKTARDADDSWQLRQVKLRATRLVTVAGLLLLVGESNARADKLAWLGAQLDLAPLARIERVMSRYPDADGGGFDTLIGAYETVQAALIDPATRARLVATGPARIDELGGVVDPAFAALEPALDRIGAVLTRFILARRDDWDPRFFERLLL